MSRRDVSWTVALCVSMVGHAAVLYVALESKAAGWLDELRRYGRPGVPAGLRALAETERSGLLAPLAEAPALALAPEPAPVAPEVVREPPPELRPNIGDETGGGESATRSPGDKPQEARENDVAQASLGRLPEGTRRAGEGGTGAAAGVNAPSGGGGTGGGGAPGPRGSADNQPAAPPVPPEPQNGRTARGEQSPGSRRGDDGVLKALPPDAGSPQVGVAAVAPLGAVESAGQRERRQRVLENAREAQQVREGKGKSQTATTSDERGTAETAATPPDNRPVGDKKVDEDRQGKGKSAVAGAPAKAAGESEAARPVGAEPTELKRQRERLASQDATSPTGTPNPDGTGHGTDANATADSAEKEGTGSDPAAPSQTRTPTATPPPPTDRTTADARPPAAVPETVGSERESASDAARSDAPTPPAQRPDGPVAGVGSAATGDAGTDKGTGLGGASREKSVTPGTAFPDLAGQLALSTPTPATPARQPPPDTIVPRQPPAPAPRPQPQAPQGGGGGGAPGAPGGAGSTGGKGDGRAPGDPARPGDPALQSDSESDPFSRTGAVSFSRGRVDARFGRKVRWVRPKLTLAGQIDAGTTARSAVVLGVQTDAVGNVTKVEVLESSGSPDSIDLPIVRAVYSWWIEPPKNAKGEPIPDTMVWRIELR